ncbi:MAG: hypothetical protein WAP35_09300, partial [Solirubrobacterales bacterium]
KALLMTLARNFEIELVEPAEAVEERFAFTMTPSRLLVRLRERATVAAAGLPARQGGTRPLSAPVSER